MASNYVAIIGGGLAGITAAIESERNGGIVRIIEKCNKMGGNSAKATSGINGVYSREQKLRKSKDCFKLFKKDTMKGGYDENNEDLVDILVGKSSEAIGFLEAYGLELNRLTQCGGHSTARTHRCDPNKVKNNVGKEIVTTLLECIKKIPNIEISVSSEVIKIDRKEEKFFVTYVQNGEMKFFECNSVVVASGGYAANAELVKSLLKGSYPTTNGIFAGGEMLKICENAFNADLCNLSHIQVHPTGIVNPKDPSSKFCILAPEALRAYGGILVNEKGKRFVNELGTRDVVQDSIRKNCSKLCGSPFRVARLLMPEYVIKRFGVNYLKFYRYLGLIKEFENGEELCRDEGIKPECVKETFSKYNECSIGKVKDEFGKVVFPCIVGFNSRLFQLYVTPSAHYCMGGIRISKKAEILTKKSFQYKWIVCLWRSYFWCSREK